MKTKELELALQDVGVRWQQGTEGPSEDPFIQVEDPKKQLLDCWDDVRNLRP